MTNTDTLQNLQAEVQAGLKQVDVLSGQIGTLLATVQMDNVRLTMENQALKRELSQTRATLHELRQVVKGLQQQEQAFRKELIREMVYTAELTEEIEDRELGIEDRESKIEEGDEGDWEGCVWEVGE